MTERDTTPTDPSSGSVRRRVPRRASRAAGPPQERPALPEPAVSTPATTTPTVEARAAAAEAGPAPRTSDARETETRARDGRGGRRRTRERPARSEQPPAAPPERAEDEATRDRNARADRRRRAENERSDRLARTLQTHRKTQVPTDIALRAREYAQPDADDLRQAEAEVVLVRRNYVPPAPLNDDRPGGGRGGRGRRRS